MSLDLQRRSNRPLTHFACKHLDAFLKDKVEPFEDTLCNTKVKYEIGLRRQHTFTVYLYNTSLLEITLVDEEPIHVAVCVGNLFSNDGHPTKTTIERLNGLLDELGHHGIIANGVRVFKDRIENIFYLGKGDNKIAVGRQYAKNVILRPDPYDFYIEASDLSVK